MHGMTDWGALQHAYGSAEDIPALLASAAETRETTGKVWDDLWSRLCHQGTVYSASRAALPALAAMASSREPAGYQAPLHLAAAIVASRDGQQEADVRREYATDIATMRDLAERNLGHHDGFVDFVYGLQALMAFENVPVWSIELEALADGELTLACPSCGEDASYEPTSVTPGDPTMSAAGARMHALALEHGRVDVASALPLLFGRATCPRCQQSFDIPAALV
jgi:hypothetical protein